MYSSRAVACARSQRLGANPHHAIDAVVLAKKLSSFCILLENAGQGSDQGTLIPLLAPRYLAFSALFVALDGLSCPESLNHGAGYAVSSKAKTEEELALQSQSIHFVQEASEEVHKLANALSASVLQDRSVLRRVCPFILDALYYATATFYWRLGETGADIFRSSVENLDTALNTVGMRWKLGKTYAGMAKFYHVSARVD